MSARSSLPQLCRKWVTDCVARRGRRYVHPTYCAARLQTLDHGAPVSPYTVGKELGHGGDSLVKRVYGHLGTVRHRSAAVEYRVQQHLKAQHRERAVREWVRALRQAA